MDMKIIELLIKGDMASSMVTAALNWWADPTIFDLHYVCESVYKHWLLMLFLSNSKNNYGLCKREKCTWFTIRELEFTKSG